MPQETLVLQLGPEAQTRLAQALEQHDFERRSVPHAHLSVKANGVVATLYRSGKLVVQGSEVRWFADRFLDGAAPSGPADAPIEVGERTLVGSDEAGKGDYFGPLVVAAVVAEPSERAELSRAGVADSKTLSDDRVRVLAAALEQRYTCAIERLMPEEYNRSHAEFGSLNPLLAELHARCIRRLARPGCLVLVDKFADDALIARRLTGLDLELHQRTRAEREPVVAAASILARAAFLDGLAQLSEAFAVDLHKGAGDPVDRVGREFLRLHGAETLGKVAKLHFKNTRKIGG